ncbi:hypothetical protein [Bartonella bacilliformis]|uniref:Uncharacterized protein n=1 Tax=Bartonella bacilliformis Ver097 TaxID=1293911 RepID=A0A072R659_BARBA|nr:hypothetical protein [Bartonella bacilliformis]KEG21116.1 hypothetical protein H710_00063 [Bartonella bacilliformis Ver097]
MNAKYPIVVSIFSLGLITAAQGENFAGVKEQMLDADITVENCRSDHQESNSLDLVLKNSADAGDYEWSLTDERIQKISYSKGKNKSFWNSPRKKRNPFSRSPFSF